jgi:uncharacterized Ntn-hydrolase superfamily protein
VTWSIIARDERTGSLAIAVATKFFAVGACVPHLASRVGAVATQALFNSFYGTNGLHLMRAGVPPDEVVRSLIATDFGRDHRQVHLMDASGRIAAHTGAACIGWCGHLEGKDFSLAGNMLAGARVLDDTAAMYAANDALPFARRLVTAMRAGDAAGGDKRGKQSAALVIYGEEDWADLDLRVDDHPDPLAELDHLETVSRAHFVPMRKFLPSRSSPVGVTDRRIIEAEIAKAIAVEAER